MSVVLDSFEHYRDFTPLVPVVRVTDPRRASIHRFHDTSPISPSGRYLAVTEFWFDDRLPGPGDEALVVVIDLHDGRRVFERPTTAWDTQVGAHVQWGADDHRLFFNSRDATDRPATAVVADPLTGACRALGGAVAMASPDGGTLLAPDLEKLPLVQAGYGVRTTDSERFRHLGFPENDGLFATSVDTGERRLILSHADLARRQPVAFAGLDRAAGGLYGFQVKWHPLGDRILYLVRWLPAGRVGGTTRNWLFTLDPDGGDVRGVLGWRRWGGGHHPNWFPQRHDVVMNLGFDATPRSVLRLMRFTARAVRRLGIPVPLPGRLHFALVPGYGGTPTRLDPRSAGSGHPTLDPSERFVLTDAYPDERVAYGDGTVPLRLLDLSSGVERHLLRIRTRAAFEGPRAEWRVDPHPAWSRDGRRIAFNACPNGVRGVFIAEVGEYLDRIVGGVAS